MLRLGDCCFFRFGLRYGKRLVQKDTFRHSRWPLFCVPESGPEFEHGPASTNCWWTPRRACFEDQFLALKRGPRVDSGGVRAVAPISTLNLAPLSGPRGLPYSVPWAQCSGEGAW